MAMAGAGVNRPVGTDDFWPSSGFHLLQRNARGWLVPTDAWLARFLTRPELALVDESCAAEQALHQELHQAPRMPVSETRLLALADADVRTNYRLFLGFRDRVLQAGTLEACYLALFRQGITDTPPLFIDVLAQAIVRNALDGCREALVARAAELLFRAQRISTEKLAEKVGRVMDVIVDEFNDDEDDAPGTKLIGRTKGDAPGIDGQVYLFAGEFAGTVKIGDIVRVRIEDSDEYDDFGRKKKKKNKGPAGGSAGGGSSGVSVSGSGNGGSHGSSNGSGGSGAVTARGVGTARGS